MDSKWRQLGLFTTVIGDLVLYPLAGIILGSLLTANFDIPREVVAVLAGMGFAYAVWKVVQLAKKEMKRES